MKDRNQNMPEAQDMKKFNKKNMMPLIIVLVLMAVAFLLEGAVGDILRIVVIVICVVFIVKNVKNRKHTWK